MSSLPGSFDGAEGDVLDAQGRIVASVALDDQRELHQSAETNRTIGVQGCFEGALETWAAQLPRGLGDTDSRTPLEITIVLPNGERLDRVMVSAPTDDAHLPIHSLNFPLSHPDFEAD